MSGAPDRSAACSMILAAAGERARGRVLDDGCGLGLYLQRLAAQAQVACGVEFDAERARQAEASGLPVARAAGRASSFRTAAAST